jgi:hypothetical protein
MPRESNQSPALFEDVLERPADPHEHDAEPVQVPALLLRLAPVVFEQLGVLVHEGRDQEQPEHANRQVDEEDPRPVIVVDDVAAKRGPDGRPEHDGHGEERHRHALLLGRKGLTQDGCSVGCSAPPRA